MALGLGAYASILIPVLDARMQAIGAVVVFTALNYVGVRRTSRVNLAIVAVSLGSLIIFAAAGAGSFRMANLQPFMPAGWGGVFEASAILFFAYTGYARIATLGEEVRDPKRTIPRAIVTTIVSASLLYLAVAAVAVGAVGADALAGNPAPLAEAARTRGTWLRTVVAAGAVTAMLGVILSQILGLSRMVFAMARRADLPPALAAVHPRYGTPHRAVLAVGAAAAIVAAFGTLQTVAAAASFAILVYYGIANLSALRLPPEDRLYPSVVPMAGAIVCAVLALALSPRTILGGVILLVVGVAVRLLMVFQGKSDAAHSPSS